MVTLALLILAADPRVAWEACLRQKQRELAPQVGTGAALAIVPKLCQRHRAEFAAILGWESAAYEQDTLLIQMTDQLATQKSAQ